MNHTKIKPNLIFEIVLRVSLWMLFLLLDNVEPFVRVIQEEEIWLYKYPNTSSYVPALALWSIILFVPMTFIILQYMKNRNQVEFTDTVLALSLNYSLLGPLVQFFKIIAGRPRPDFFYRCFPDGEGTDFTKCAGSKKLVADGRKSFPSGHSAFAFSSMLFLSLYFAGKLKVFTDGGRGISWRLCACILPLLLASAIAISRTCDYHHHWEDVLAGSILGSIIAYVCYRQYFPSISSQYCNVPYSLHSLLIELNN